MRKKWTDADIEYLANNYADVSISEIADYLSRTKMAVRVKAKNLGLYKRKVWTVENRKFLKENYGAISNKSLAEKMGVSVPSLKGQAMELGLCSKVVLKKIIVDISDKEAISLCSVHGETLHRKNARGSLTCIQCSKDYYQNVTKKKEGLPDRKIIAYEHVKAEFAKAGYKLLSVYYKNSAQKLDIVCDKGHEVSTTWNAFVTKRGCRSCARINRGITNKQNGKKRKRFYASLENNVRARGYVLCTPFEKYQGSLNKVELVCSVGHRFEMVASRFYGGAGCPECAIASRRADIGRVRQQMLEEGYILLSDVYKNNSTKLEVRCPNGHIFLTTWSYFNSGCRCMECYRERAGITIGIVKKGFEDANYTLLSEEYVNNRTRLRYICENEHPGETDWEHFGRGGRCKKCADDRHRLTLEYATEKFKERGLELLEDTYIDRKTPMKFRCVKNHERSMTLSSVVNGCGCKRCASGNRASKGEQEVSRFISSIYSGEVINNTRSVIPPLEVDIYLPEKKLAIEYNGLYWHSKKQDKKADFNKFISLKEKGIRYIGIFEDEWVKRREFVEKYLTNVLGLSRPSFILRPQEISVERVSYREVRPLLDEHHYSGARAAKYYFGLVHEEKLIGCVLIAKPTRQQVDADWEIVRMCLDPKYKVHGMWSYISKHVLEDFFPGQKIVSFSDNRRDSGLVYRHMGFVEDDVIRPDYYWCKGIDRFHKSGLRKTDDEKKTGKTEVCLREAQGFTQIYDVGKTRWVYNKQC